MKIIFYRIFFTEFCYSANLDNGLGNPCHFLNIISSIITDPIDKVELQTFPGLKKMAEIEKIIRFFSLPFFATNNVPIAKQPGLNFCFKNLTISNEG